MILLSICLIALMMTCRSHTGWIAVVGASVIFGSTGIPMKSPELLDDNRDENSRNDSQDNNYNVSDKNRDGNKDYDDEEDNNPIIFACYTGIGIFIVSIPLLVYFLISSLFQHQTITFQYNLWAILGSLDIFIINYFAFQAVLLLGYAKAPALWAG